MSLLKPILRPALRSTLSSIVGAIRRYFTTFDPVSQTYVQLSSAVNAAQITMDVYSASGDNTGLPTGAPALTAGQLETITFAYSGSISEIGRNGSSYFDGIIANVKIQDAGATVLDMPIDSSDYSTGSNIVENKAGELGVNELPSFVTPDILENQAQATVDGNSLSIISDGSQGFPRVVYTNRVVAGRQYVVTVTGDLRNTANKAFVALGSGSAERLRFDSSLVGLRVTKSQILTAETDDVRFYLDEDTSTIDTVNPVIFENISIREVPSTAPYGEFINVAAADTELYTLQDGAWVSDTKTIPVA